MAFRGRPPTVTAHQPIAYYRDVSIDDNAPCKVCAKTDSSDKNDIVFCDSCNMAFHASCHRPPIKLEELMADTWFCAPCRLRYRGVRVADWAGCPARLGGIEDEFSQSSELNENGSEASDSDDNIDDLNENSAFIRLSAMVTMGDADNDRKRQGRKKTTDEGNELLNDSNAADILLENTSNLNVAKLGAKVAETACKAAELQRLRIRVSCETDPPSANGKNNKATTIKTSTTRELELHEQLLLLPEKHLEEKDELINRFARLHVPYWTSLVRGGIPVCLWGIGSKARLLDLLAERLDDSVCLSINGADDTLDVKDALTALARSQRISRMSEIFAAGFKRSGTEESLKSAVSIRAATIEILKQLDKPNSLALSLILHCIDGPAWQASASANCRQATLLTTSAVVQTAQHASAGVSKGGPLDCIQRLLQHPRVRVVASADSREFILRCGRWWHVEEAHTWIDYREECLAEGGGKLPSWLGLSKVAEKDSTNIADRINELVMVSLTEAHKKLISRLARIYFLSKTLDWIGLSESDLFEEAKACGAATSLFVLRRLLKEVMDHEVVLLENGKYKLPLMPRSQMKILMTDADKRMVDSEVSKLKKLDLEAKEKEKHLGVSPESNVIQIN